MDMDYDITESFKKIENELMSSMMRNLERHLGEEETEGFNWNMWQTEQLETLEQYKKVNKAKYAKKFKNINIQVDSILSETKSNAALAQEGGILEAIKNGFKGYKKTSSDTFFKLNERKLEALISSTQNDFKKAEVAMLRMADDQYRKIIFNAQVYANTGAGTQKQAVDMATKDFLQKGINCIEYKNGRRVNIAAYVDMAIRTADKRAYLMGEGEKRQEWGISTVLVHGRGGGCPKCLPFQNKVFVDDVWSGGSGGKGGEYPLLSSAISAGLYHPNCKDSHGTFYPGIDEEPKSLTKKEVDESTESYKVSQKQNYAKHQKEKFKRLADNSLDDNDRKKYKAKEREWQKIYAAADSARNTGMRVNYNKNYDYSVQLDGYSDAVNKGVSDASREVARLGGIDGNEHMFLVNLESGKLDHYETNGMPGEVGYDIWEYLGNNKDRKYAFVHNHNTNSSFSEPDIRTLITAPEIPVMVATRNDAVKYVAERKGDIVKGGLFDEIYKDEIQELNIALKDGKITAGERTKRREELIVSNLLRDHTKGGKLIEIDGRG